MKNKSCGRVWLAALILICFLAGCGAESSYGQEKLSRLTIELQKGITWGEYDDNFDDSLGGTALLLEGEPCGGMELIGSFTAQTTADGKPTAVTLTEKAGTLADFESLPSPCPCVTAQYTDTNGSVRYCAFWLPEKQGPLYMLWLDADLCSRELLNTLAMTVDLAP